MISSISVNLIILAYDKAVYPELFCSEKLAPFSSRNLTICLCPLLTAYKDTIIINH